MRVLHVHSGNLFGGVETMLLTQARSQHLCPGLEFEFALCFSGRLRDELNAMGAPLHDLGTVRLRDPLSLRRARRNLQKLLRREKFDAIVTHSCWTQAVFGPTLRAADAPLVFYLHAPADGRHWLERAAKRTRPDLVVCNSQFTADSVSALYPGVRSDVVHCPVSTPGNESSSPRNRMRTELQTPEDATVIIQVGRMEGWKGHALHLEALAKLPGNSNWVCWIVGGAQRPSEHKYVDELMTLAQQLGIADRLRFLGQRDDVNDLLASADIFCQPNTAGESFGISFVEALYAGLPVVTSEIGGAREIVDETCGILVPPGNAGLVATALQRLITDPAQRRRLGSAGPTRATELCEPSRQLKRFYAAVELLPDSTRVCVTESNPATDFREIERRL